MLLADLVGGAADPVLSIPAVVAVHIYIDFLRGGELACLLSVLLELHPVDFLSSAPSDTNLAIDATCCLTEEVVLGGYVACVPWEVLTSPSSRLLLCITSSVFRLERRRILICCLGHLFI